MLQSEVHIVDSIFMSFQFVSLLSFSLSITVIVQTENCIPGGSNDIILVITPVNKARYIFFLFVSLFFRLLELFHFDTILHVYAIYSAPLISNEQFSFTFV